MKPVNENKMKNVENSSAKIENSCIFENRWLLQSKKELVNLSTFLKLNNFPEICFENIGNRSINILENMLSVFIRLVSSKFQECFNKTHKAAKLKLIVAHVLVYFQMLYQHNKLISSGYDNSRYLDLMTELVAMYVDLEIKAFRQGAECLKKIGNSISSALFVFLDNSENHIAETILKAKLITKTNEKLCALILSKFLTEADCVVSDETEYIRFLLVFKLWKKIRKDLVERKSINRMAITKLNPPPSIVEEMKTMIDILPNENVTLLLMNSRFDVFTSKQRFLNRTRRRSYVSTPGSLLINSFKSEKGSIIMNLFDTVPSIQYSYTKEKSWENSESQKRITLTSSNSESNQVNFHLNDNIIETTDTDEDFLELADFSKLQKEKLKSEEFMMSDISDIKSTLAPVHEKKAEPSEIYNFTGCDQTIDSVKNVKSLSEKCGPSEKKISVQETKGNKEYDFILGKSKKSTGKSNIPKETSHSSKKLKKEKHRTSSDYMFEGMSLRKVGFEEVAKSFKIVKSKSLRNVSGIIENSQNRNRVLFNTAQVKRINSKYFSDLKCKNKEFSSVTPQSSTFSREKELKQPFNEENLSDYLDPCDENNLFGVNKREMFNHSNSLNLPVVENLGTNEAGFEEEKTKMMKSLDEFSIDLFKRTQHVEDLTNFLNDSFVNRQNSFPENENLSRLNLFQGEKLPDEKPTVENENFHVSSLDSPMSVTLSDNLGNYEWKNDFFDSELKEILDKDEVTLLAENLHFDC